MVTETRTPASHRPIFGFLRLLAGRYCMYVHHILDVITPTVRTHALKSCEYAFVKIQRALPASLPRSSYTRAALYPHTLGTRHLRRMYRVLLLPSKEPNTQIPLDSNSRREASVEKGRPAFEVQYTISHACTYTGITYSRSTYSYIQQQYIYIYVLLLKKKGKHV